MSNGHHLSVYDSYNSAYLTFSAYLTGCSQSVNETCSVDPPVFLVVDETYVCFFAFITSATSDASTVQYVYVTFVNMKD